MWHTSMPEPAVLHGVVAPSRSVRADGGRDRRQVSLCARPPQAERGQVGQAAGRAHSSDPDSAVADLCPLTRT